MYGQAEASPRMSFLEWDKFVSVPVRQPRDFSKFSTKMKG